MASDPLATGLLKLVVNAEHPEHGAYFHAILVATVSSQPHSLNEFATLPILLRCVRRDPLPFCRQAVSPVSRAGHAPPSPAAAACGASVSRVPCMQVWVPATQDRAVDLHACAEAAGEGRGAA